MNIHTWKHRAFVILILVLMSGCSSVKLDDYAGNSPELNAKDFFDGQLTAHGIVKNRSGKVIRYFTADIAASWSADGVGTLDESFVFNDGEKQKRVWTLVPNADGSFEASANDVVGKSRLATSGNALFMRYTLTIPYKGKSLNVKVDDRMYLVNDTTLLNESVMTKWGFEVGYVTLVITKQ
ncbi:DUF3833 domain-containing protein [Teredinibacter turnerae]|uniref:DUF3833 domain-containing protein n=1 Tax=Teredinibacter turnerae TaxID=2426 RepID=UPI000424F3D7|nr:DUF3833 domain-containing protein [Teredinibacter turnerae]